MLWHSQLTKTIAFKGQTYVQVVFPAKPAKSGLNVWEGAIAQNGCVQFQIYTGKHGVAEWVLEWFKI